MMGQRKMAVVGQLRSRRRQVTLLLMAMAAALMLSSGVALAATITCQVNVECNGTPEPDALEGTAGNDHIYGRGNNDILRGRGLIDWLYGQDGSDRLFGGPDTDYLTGGPGDDELNGGGGYDYYFILTNDWGKDSIADSTSSGNPLLFNGDRRRRRHRRPDHRAFPSAGPEVKNASATSTINWESDTHIPCMVSGAGDDTITGDLHGNTIDARQGEDTISSEPGNDYIYVADEEVDHVNCGSDNFGGQNHDVVYYDSLDVVSANCEEQILITP